jgi:hypothetical protein
MSKTGECVENFLQNIIYAVKSQTFHDTIATHEPQLETSYEFGAQRSI